MPRPRVPISLLSLVIAIVMAPVLLCLLVFVAIGWLPAPMAWLSGGALVLVIGIILRPHLSDLLALREYGSDVARHVERDPPVLTFPFLTVELEAAISRLSRMWRKDHKALSDSLSTLDTVLDRLPDPLFMLNRERSVVRSNIAAHNVLTGAHEGRNLAAVLRNPEVLEATDKVLAGGEGRQVEFSLPVPVERSFLAWIELLPEPASDGTVAILRLYDQTEEKKTKQLHADFLANASHELKTPLATLIGNIETLLGPARDDEEAREKFLATMQGQSIRMKNLVDDLLSLSRIERQEHTPPSSSVSLAAILENVITLLTPLAEKKSQAIGLEISNKKDPALTVLGDGGQLEQVFINLIDNGIKYGRPSSEILVTAKNKKRAGQHFITVTIADQGEGIPREHLTRLTERFYRADSARSRELGGTGLGLAIVKHIVSRHQGDLNISSTPGKGSAFTVFLPIPASTEDGQGR